MNEKELLEQLVAECSSLSEILEKLGKSNSGASLKVLKEKLDTYGISYHFLNTRRYFGRNIPLEEILLKDRPFKSSSLKKKLLDFGLKENKCELCGLLPFHNGRPLVLLLDHINGDHNDNRLENLRILCPNCHSQTETYSGRKNKTLKETNLSDKELINKPSKEELLKLIETTSFSEIGNMYNKDEISVKRWCKSYGLPDTKYKLREYSLNPSEYKFEQANKKEEKEKINIDDSLLIRIYNEGYSLSEISKYCGYRPNIISERLKSKNVKIKTNYNRKIGLYDLSGNFILYFHGTLEIKEWFLKELNKEIKSTTTITDCCRGRNKTSYGFIWKYEERIPIEEIK